MAANGSPCANFCKMRNRRVREGCHTGRHSGAPRSREPGIRIAVAGL